MTIDERINHIQKQCDDINALIAEIFKMMSGTELTLQCRLCKEYRPWKEIVDNAGDCNVCSLQHAEVKDD